MNALAASGLTIPRRASTRAVNGASLSSLASCVMAAGERSLCRDSQWREVIACMQFQTWRQSGPEMLFSGPAG